MMSRWSMIGEETRGGGILSKTCASPHGDEHEHEHERELTDRYE
jgi:hypothetical protein